MTRAWASLVVIVAVLLPWTVMPGEALARPILDWLQYDPGVHDDYEVVTETGDSARNAIEPIWASAAERASAKRVMVLIPKASVEAYSISVNTILQVFERRRVPARFDVWFYDEDEKIAHEALAFAYAQPADLIISAGSSATAFLHAEHRGHAIPAVTSASKDPVALGQVADPKTGSGTNIAYTSINVATDTLVAYLRRLMPELITIGVLYSKDNPSAIGTQVKPLDAAAEKAGLTIVHMTVDGPATATADLDRAIPEGLANMRKVDPGLRRSLLLVTGSTPVYERISQINRHAVTLPVISMLPDIVRSGEDSALLSIGVNLTSAVALSAHYAVEILAGRAEPGALPVGAVSPPDLAINFLIARRIGIKVPFAFFESATFVYNIKGDQVIAFGQRMN
ncbi:MAG: hypothetical protein HQ481_11750 [Alphaproteobacteria bacterium]|nr:hypothetical protein [Alphaproteobacteria bacterium]